MPTRSSEATIKRLFALSGNRCAYPACPVAVVTDGSVTAQICHIKARSPEGPRFDPAQTDATRHAFDNLLLLCGVHHKVVDDAPEIFTVEKLQEMKERHEAAAVGARLPALGDQQVAALLATIDVAVSDSVIVEANTIAQSQIAHTITNYFGASGTPPHELDYSASPERVAEWARRLLAAQYAVPLRHALQRGAAEFFGRYRASAEAREAESPPQASEELSRVLDAMTAVTIEAAEHGAGEIVAAADSAFYRVYERAASEQGLTKVARAWVWGEVLRRVYVLGAVYLERDRLADAATLAARRASFGAGAGEDPWAKHGLRHLADAHLNQKRLGLVTYTLGWLDRSPWCLASFGADADRALSKLCQFDFLQCAIAVRRAGSIRAAYPSFADYEPERVEPLVARLVANRPARAELLGPIDDVDLADLVRDLADLAGRASFHALGPWTRPAWQDPVVRAFLGAHRWPPDLSDVARAVLVASARSVQTSATPTLLIEEADQGWFPPRLLGELRAAGFGTMDYRPALEELARSALLSIGPSPTRHAFGSYALTERGLRLGGQLSGS